jgi:plasmid maintenance system antidote protein VapI
MLSSKTQRGQLSRAAEALNCQRSYLSRVISESLQLTPDHAFKLARFWRLTSDEREYFQTMVDYERAGDPEYRAHLKQRLLEVKRKHESIQERTARTAFSVYSFQVG